MPYLHFSTEDFAKLSIFSKFVTHVLSNRNNEAEVSYCGNGLYISLTSTWELPALTTLHLSNVTLCDDITEKYIGAFSKCANLKNIILKRYKTMSPNGFTICHPQLSNLTLENEDWTIEVVNVVAPQLENLTIKTYQRKCRYLVSAPNLKSLLCKGYASLQLNTDGFHLLEKAHLCVSSPFSSDVYRIVWLLEQLNNVKSLTLNLEVVELLSSFMELISHLPAPFANLKKLSIYPEKLEKCELRKEQVTMSTVVNKYLLGGCPGANITMVSREEAKSVRNAKCARKVITDLRVFLEEEKANYEINRAEIARGKEPIGESTKQIENSWKDLMIAQFNQKNDIDCYIISELQSIEKLLAQLPASNRAVVDNLMNKMMDDMKINCDKNQSCSSS